MSNRIDASTLDLKEKLVCVNRVSKTVKDVSRVLPHL